MWCVAIVAASLLQTAQQQQHQQKQQKHAGALSSCPRMGTYVGQVQA
jgi:hypothetical protein